MDRVEKVRKTLSALVDSQFSFEVSQNTNCTVIMINTEFWELHFEIDDSDYVKIEELFPGWRPGNGREPYRRLIEWKSFGGHLKSYINYLVNANDDPKLVSVPMTIYCELRTISGEKLLETIKHYMGQDREFTLRFRDHKVTLTAPDGEEESWVFRD